MMAAGTDGDEARWIRSAVRGDTRAFGELVRLHEAWVRGFLRARIRDWASADDLAQDVFVTAFRKIRTYRAESAFHVWLRGIAINHLRNFIRKRREEHVGGSVELEVLADRSCSEWEGMDGGCERTSALKECLARLDGPVRALLHERYTIGKSVREMAAESGKGYSALTMQLLRVRETLARCIELKLGRTES